MNFVTRSINILTQPKAEMARAGAEPATTASLIAGYAALLAVLPALGTLLSSIIFSGGSLNSWIPDRGRWTRDDQFATPC